MCQLPHWWIIWMSFAILEACNLGIHFSQTLMPLQIYCSALHMKWKGCYFFRRKYLMENILRNTLVIFTWGQFDVMNSLYIHTWNLRQINKANIGLMLLRWKKHSHIFFKLGKSNRFTKLTGRAEKLSPLVFLSFLVPWCATKFILNEWASKAFHRF